MKAIKLLIMLITLMTLATPRYVQAGDRLHRDFRVRPEGRYLMLVCRAKSFAEEEVSVHIGYDSRHLHEANRNRYHIDGESMGTSVLRLVPGRMRVRVRDIEDVLLPWGREDLDYSATGYKLITWRIRHESTQTICLGATDADGNIRSPVVNPNNPNIEMYLGFVYHPWNKLEVCFLFLNGTDENITLAQPLDRTSHIHVSMPAIDYCHDLFIPGQEAEQVTIEAGKVGEWRLPWQTVIDLIPADELEQIKTAGGDIDMVWRVGEHQSMPLPISLVAADNEDVHRWVRPVRMLASQQSRMLGIDELVYLKGRIPRMYELGFLSKKEIEQSILWTEEYLEAERDRLTPENRAVVESYLKELKEVRNAIAVNLQDED